MESCAKCGKPINTKYGEYWETEINFWRKESDITGSPTHRLFHHSYCYKNEKILNDLS